MITNLHQCALEQQELFHNHDFGRLIRAGRFARTLGVDAYTAAKLERLDVRFPPRVRGNFAVDVALKKYRDILGAEWLQ